MSEIDDLRARTQARARQMLQELLAPEPPQTRSEPAGYPSLRDSVGGATAAIEELAVKTIRRQYWLFGSDLSLYDPIAALRRRAQPKRFDEHLTTLVAHLVADGMATGEFSRRDVRTAARAIVECLKSATHPFIARRSGRQAAEMRARAQVRFIARALA